MGSAEGGCMSSVVLTKGQTGKLEGMGEKGARLYAKFLKAVGNLQPGDTLGFSYKVPRSPKFHRLHMTMIGQLFDNQEQFADEYQFRKWTEVGAGHCDFVPGPKGRMVALPRSIDFESLDDEEFRDVHVGVKAFLRTEHAARFLWPDVDIAQSLAGIETILASFEGGQ